MSPLELGKTIAPRRRAIDFGVPGLIKGEPPQLALSHSHRDGRLSSLSSVRFQDQATTGLSFRLTSGSAFLTQLVCIDNTKCQLLISSFFCIADSVFHDRIAGFIDNARACRFYRALNEDSLNLQSFTDRELLSVAVA